LLDLNAASKSVNRGAIFFHVIDNKRLPNTDDRINVHTFNNSEAWLWIIPFSDGTASVGVVGSQELISDFSSNSYQKFKESIQEFRGLNSRFKELKPITDPTSIEDYSIGIKQTYGKGYVLCGNSTEFLDPVFSSGVTLAAFSGLQAAKLVEKELNGGEVDWEHDYANVLGKGIEVFRSYVEAWYNGDLHTIFFAKNVDPNIKNQICSVLSGYVWDNSNPFVKKHKTILSTLAKVVSLKEEV